MSQEMNTPDSLQEIESLLHSVHPAPPGLDPAPILFEAGRIEGLRANRRILRLWQTAASLLVGISLGLGLLATSRSPSTPMPPSFLVHDPSTPVPAQHFPALQTLYTVAQPTPSPSNPDAYLHLRAASLLQLPSNDTPATGGTSRPGAPLRTGDGLDALPAWQQQSILFPGARS